MTQLKNNSHYKNLLANEHFKGQVDKIDDEYNTLKVSVQTSHSGTLTIFHSLDSLVWSSFGDVFTITEDTHKQVALKGKYLYVSYLNGATETTNFNIVSYLSKSIHNNIDVKLTQEDEVSVVPVGGAMDVEVVNSLTIEGMTFTPEGALIVSGGGGGGGGDASAANQLTQIGLETTIKNDLAIMKAESLAQTIVQEAINDKIDVRLIKCDTDNVIIDSSNPVQTLLLAKVENTLNNAFLNVDAGQNLKVIVSNQNDISTLATQETQEEIKTQLDKLTFVDSKLKVIEEPLITTEPIYLDFDNNSAQVIADSPVGCWYNPDDDVEGWGYSNETVGGAQVYYYTNTGLVPNATEPNINLGSVSTGWCVASLDLITTTENTWIMSIYTKPTGSGDAQIWYHSRKSYQVNSSFPISKGVDYLFYWGENPVSVHPELQHVEMALASTQGTADPSEIVQFMSLNVPSIVPQFQFQGRVKRAGYIRSGVSREVHFLNSNKVRSELKLQQLKFNTILPNLQDEAPLFVSIDKATYTEDEISADLQLNVRDNKLSRELASMNSTIQEGVYINMETDPVVSGGVKLSGDAATKSLYVNVTNTEAIPVSGTFWQETQPVSGSVSVSNFPETQPVSGSVNVSNFPETQPVTGTFWQETQPVSGLVGVTGPVDSHLYGYHNSAWQQVALASSGHLLVNSSTHDGAGNDITSTVDDEVRALDVAVKNVITSNLRTSVNGLLSSSYLAGPTGYNALDVSVKSIGDVNSVLKTATNGTLTSTLSGTGNSINSLDVNVQNTSITAIQKSQPASVQTILTNEICNCAGPTDSRALTTSYDTTGFLYVSVILNITNFSMSGYGNPTLYLQSSPDGVLWFNESSNSIYQNGPVKIQVYSVLTVPYVRLYLDCNSITPPNIIQFTISTALLCQK